MSDLVWIKPQLVAKAQGERGPRPEHEWRGPRLRFEKASGEWGEFVDLKGSPGPEVARMPIFFDIVRDEMMTPLRLVPTYGPGKDRPELIPIRDENGLMTRIECV